MPPVAALLEGAPVIASSGRSYPVETRYLPQRVAGRVEAAVVRAVCTALAQTSGDLLVFLPGAGEIRRVEAQLAALELGPQIRVAPLHGNLSQAAQDQAIAPMPPGERKVVLATSIAETSLTVAGVQAVVDSGLMRVPRFSPRTGMTRLETVPVSRAAAGQRRGRAGRLGPGMCYRLWTQDDDRRLVARNTPEILEADLAPVALELAVWGVADPGDLCWLDPPPAAALAQARDLLRQLGALTPDGVATPHGQRMASMGLHPRLAHMVLRGLHLGRGALATELAALLSERDVLRGSAPPGDGNLRREGRLPDADLRLRVAALRSMGDGNAGGPTGSTVDPAAIRQVHAAARRWQQDLRIPPGSADDVDDCGILLAFAYPDRVAQRRPDGRYLLRNGRGAALAGIQPLGLAPYLVAADLDDQGPESRIYLAAPVDLSHLELHLGDQMAAEEMIAWDAGAQAVRARRRRRLGALVLRDDPIRDPDPAAMVTALIKGVAAEGLAILPWTRASRQFQQRAQFMRQYAADWPDVSDVALAATLPSWLAPHLFGLRGRTDLQGLDVLHILESLLTHHQRRALDAGAPTHCAVPGGSRIAIDYSDPAAPVLAVRLQELFGLAETPRIAGGKVPLTLHLLSPAHRPVQVTRDLASFWRTAYFDVRKDLRGRYPKHFWPDDPLQAPATRRVRRRPGGMEP